MEEPISNLTDTIIGINWQLSVYINPENIEKIKEDCERLLTKVFNKYKVELRYEETLYVLQQFYHETLLLWAYMSKF